MSRLSPHLGAGVLCCGGATRGDSRQSDVTQLSSFIVRVIRVIKDGEKDEDRA
jgi:hypothetical protein